MAKSGERSYFKKIGKDAVEHSAHKPFSNGVTIGSLLHDIAAVFSLFPNKGQPIRVLDLGCGTGWTSGFFARAGHEVVGVDIAPEAVERAEKFFKAEKLNLSFKCSDYDKLPYKNEFDVVVFFDALHHSIDEKDGLRAAYRALKPGGKIILCEPGTGHSKHPQSIYAVETYGVNERDMPPKLSKQGLKSVGFIGTKTYAYPAAVHRALYNKGESGVTKLLRLNFLTRAVTVFLLSSALLRNHGIVEAHKPN